MTTLVLIRGIPGSGKTTLAKALFPTHELVEADMYFLKDGKYEYNPDQINDAHKWCQDRTRQLLESGQSVVVCNTFIKKWEIEPYLKMSENPPLVLVANGEFENIHGVPSHVVERMKKRFEL